MNIIDEEGFVPGKVWIAKGVISYSDFMKRETAMDDVPDHWKIKGIKRGDPNSLANHIAKETNPIDQVWIADGLISYSEFVERNTMTKPIDDTSEGRIGLWMQTSLGGRFYPEDPREDEIFISDIANGLALDCRYAGQGFINNFYSVAEHSMLCAQAALNMGYSPALCMAVLLHDAAEGYINDVNRATKAGLNYLDPEVGEYDSGGFKTQIGAYERLEKPIQDMINKKYGVQHTAETFYEEIKSIDRRIVPLEKAVLFPKDTQSWAADTVIPLPDIEVLCLIPRIAKLAFLIMYEGLCAKQGVKAEEWVL